MRLTILAALLMLGFTGTAMATPTQWSANGHWYELVTAPETSWSTANVLADAKSWNGNSGHLATITSAEENAFVFSVVGEGWYWLGGHQADAIRVDDGWSWVTGETWDYENWIHWDANYWEPNNLKYDGYGFENALVLFGGGQWNDSPEGWDHYSNGGYVVEYDNMPVPEPGTMMLLGMGMLGLAVFGKRRMNERA
jgi:hypothetical protein